MSELHAVTRCPRRHCGGQIRGETCTLCARPLRPTKPDDTPRNQAEAAERGLKHLAVRQWAKQ